MMLSEVPWMKFKVIVRISIPLPASKADHACIHFRLLGSACFHFLTIASMTDLVCLRHRFSGSIFSSYPLSKD